MTHNLKKNWHRGDGDLAGTFIRDKQVMQIVKNTEKSGYTGSTAQLHDPVQANINKMMGNHSMKLKGRPKHANPNSGEGYQQMENRANNVKVKAGAFAYVIEESMKALYRYSPTGRDVQASMDVQNQINAFSTASQAVEKFDYSSYSGDADLLRTNLTEYLVDGRLPGASSEYDTFVQSTGDMIIANNPSELNTKTDLNVDSY